MKHEQTEYTLGPAPTFYHHAHCSCGWRSKGRGHVETVRRDWEQHERESNLPKLVEGECSWCCERSARCVEFFSGLSYARLCPDCIKRMHKRNNQLATADRHVRYAERAGHAR